MLFMKLLLLPLIIFSFYSPALAQNAGTKKTHSITPPPPPPPRSKNQVSQRDAQIIKKQSKEINVLRAEILGLKAEIKELRALLSKKQNAAKTEAFIETPTIATEQKPVAQLDLAEEPPMVVETIAEPVVQKVQPIAKEETIPVVKKVKKKRKTTSVAFKNGLNKFKTNCTMFAEPNSESQKVGKVSAGKKLWIDSHNSRWRKAYKKSGTVYVHRSCF